MIRIFPLPTGLILSPHSPIIPRFSELWVPRESVFVSPVIHSWSCVSPSFITCEAVCKEEVVKTSYPVSITDIRSLIKDYQGLFSDLGRNVKTMEALRNTAQLYAFYLNERDTAITVLETAIMIAGSDNAFRDKCKLDLGDIYVLKNEPWEATLLYSQVEKSQKEDFLGQEAKLKNAKLHYYNGEFDLSKYFLDIFKNWSYFIWKWICLICISRH